MWTLNQSCRVIFAALLLCCGLGLSGCGERDVMVRERPPQLLRETVGNGRPVRDGDTVTIHYRIETPEGRTILDQRNYRFQLGKGVVIQGIDESVRGMRVGGTRVIDCPPSRHWGRAGYGDGAVPPNTNLIFHIELARAR